VVAGPVEATAMGNLMTQVRTDGEVGSLAEMREVVRRSTGVKRFQSASSRDWTAAAERFARFRGR